MTSVVNCSLCSRLRSYCQEIAIQKRKAYFQDTYWGKPVPGFGSPEAQLVIVGLAPGAHGANRTGRVFTGDRSGDWLYRALYDSGFANQPHSVNSGDGLTLNNCYITCVVKCAPPQNRPTPPEIETCSQHLKQELQDLKQARVYLALGRVAYQALWKCLSLPRSRPEFKHGKKILIPSVPGKKNAQCILLSYHPSQQNTFTGKLTQKMFDQVFQDAKSTLRGCF